MDNEYCGPSHISDRVCVSGEVHVDGLICFALTRGRLSLYIYIRFIYVVQVFIFISFVSVFRVRLILIVIDAAMPIVN